MTQIRPVSDLRNRFADISNAVKTSEDSVILTKNGYPDMVVMSYESYTRRRIEHEMYARLMEAEIEAKQTTQRHSHEEVFAHLRGMLREGGENP